MERFKKLLKKLFCLPPLATVLIAVPSLAFVFTVLALKVQGVISYVAYILSAYAMIIICTGFSGIVKAVKGYIENHPLKQKIEKHPLGNRYLNDAFFRAEVALYPGLFINLLYAGIKLFSGFYYRSLWFSALAVYYIMLAVMRFALLRSVKKHPMGQNFAYELRRYRLCGIFLLFMNQALIVIVILVIHQNRGFDYPGLLIYAMAFYAFYAVINAIVSLVSKRKHSSPVMSATNVIKLTAALVSMLSLETAMLARFGGGNDSEFRQIMMAASGGTVCAFVLGMAIFMIISSTRQIKNNKKGAHI